MSQNIADSGSQINNFYEIYLALKESGIHAAPCDHEKKSGKYGWNNPSHEYTEKDFEGTGIGILTGPTSKILVLDVDSEDEAIKELIEGALPPHKYSRIGNRNRLPARFYQASPEVIKIFESGERKNLTELKTEIKFGTFMVIPPSTHPKGYSYEWLNPQFQLVDKNSRVADLDDLPYFNLTMYNYLHQINEGLKPDKGKRKEDVFTGGAIKSSESQAGSHPEISRVTVAAVLSGKTKEEVKKEVIKADKRYNTDLGYASFFDCSRRHKEKTFKGRTGEAALNFWVDDIYNRKKDKVPKKPIEKEEALFETSIPKAPPQVESGSLFDFIFKATRDGQYVDNKKMALAVTLSVCGWLCSIGTRFMGVAPNLLILFVAPSGSGKSTSGQIINEFIEMFPGLAKTTKKGEPKTAAGFLNSFEESPVQYLIIDEATKLFRNSSLQNSHAANLAEDISEIYSDSRSRKVPRSSNLKNSSYGVCIDPQINSIMFTTESVWKFLKEENYKQGLGRRLFVMVENKVGLHKTGARVSREILHEGQRAVIKEYVDRSILFSGPYFETQNIVDFEIIKTVTMSGKGDTETKYFEECKRTRVARDLKPSMEVKEWLVDMLPKKINELKKEAVNKGSNIDLYIVNSMPEFVLKLAAIHTLCGKRMVSKGKDGQPLINSPTIVEMDSISWAVDMFLYYMIGGLSQTLGGLFNKDEEIEEEEGVAKDLLDALKKGGIKVFKKSSPVIKNFFRRKPEFNREKIVEKAVNLGFIKPLGDTSIRGVDYVVQS